VESFDDGRWRESGGEGVEGVVKRRGILASSSGAGKSVALVGAVGGREGVEGESESMATTADLKVEGKESRLNLCCC
jgi:hypothetical protein